MQFAGSVDFSQVGGNNAAAAIAAAGILNGTHRASPEQSTGFSMSNVDFTQIGGTNAAITAGVGLINGQSPSQTQQQTATLDSGTRISFEGGAPISAEKESALAAALAKGASSHSESQGESLRPTHVQRVTEQSNNRGGHGR